VETEKKPRYFLKKDDRLKSRKAIELLFAKGKSFSHAPFRIFWLLQENEKGLKAGFTAGSKNFKKAVDRNRIKRLMREAYRLQKNNLSADILLRQKGLHIFFVFTGKEMPGYETIFEKTGSALERIMKFIHENPE